jgi:hypothetical protein
MSDNADGLDAITEGRSFTKPEDQAYGDPEDGAAAKLLTLPPVKAAAFAYQLWKDQPAGPISRRRAQWQVNQWRREGRTNVYVQKTQNQNVWQAWAPPWSAPPIPVLNKADRLCRRLKAMVWSDPPVPQCVPATGDEEDVESAQFCERILKDIQGQGQLDDLRSAARAFDRASVYGSGFIRYYVDPKGGGRKPVRVMAKPGAVSAEAPFTGPQGEPLEGDLIGRYVTAEGQLVDEPGQAAQRWMPGIKKEILEAPNVRFLPHDAEDIWDADGVVIATMPTWGELLEMFPDELAEIRKEDRDKLFSFRPEKHQELLHGEGERSRNEQAKRDEDKRVAVFTVYYKACPAYPQGCYFVGLGDSLAIVQDPWTGEVNGVEEALDIPLTQYAQFDTGKRDGFAVALMELLGGGNEIRAAQVGHLMSYLDQFTNRKVFIPTNSILQARNYQLLQGTAIPINPGGKPEFEEIPDFPSAPMELYGLTSEVMNDLSGMQETAQGTQGAGVNSGRQASIIVAQSQAGLSDIQQNVERAYLRACRIQLQLVRANYTVPQQISWTGEDGQYRQQWWQGSDLGSTKDVQLKKGTLSMMTPPQKLDLHVQLQQLGVYNSNPDDFYEAIVGNMGAVAGLQDDPVRQRMKRQLAAWSLGPPKGWQPPPPPMMPGPPDPITGQPSQVPAVDPMTGQPMPPPPDPQLVAIFAPIPMDDLQDVATIRLSELKRFMAGTKYTRWPVPWRRGIDEEFARMKMAAGVLTIAEQQQAALQQQQEEQQQAIAEREAGYKHEERMAELGASSKEEPDRVIDRDPTGRMKGIRSVRRPPAAAAAS